MKIEKTTTETGWDRLRIVTLPDGNSAVMGEAILEGPAELSPVFLYIFANVDELPEGFAVSGRSIRACWVPLLGNGGGFMSINDEDFSFITDEFPF